MRRPRFNAGPGILFIPDSHLLQLQHLLAAVHAALIRLCQSSTAYDFFSYGQSTFLQCYSVALPKPLISGSVHSGHLLSTLNYSSCFAFSKMKAAMGEENVVPNMFLSE